MLGAIPHKTFSGLEVIWFKKLARAYYVLYNKDKAKHKCTNESIANSYTTGKLKFGIID